MQAETRLGFDENGAAYDQIRSKSADNPTSKAHGQRHLALHTKSSLTERKRKSLHVYGLQKSRPEFVVDLKEYTNDPLRNCRMF
jgi:hypothetical protein